MVSRQIQDREQELGFILFTRTRPQVTLTEQGREFYEEVHNVLAGLQQLDSRSREIAQGQSRTLRVAAIYTLGSSLLPSTIGYLERIRPVFEYKLYIDTFQPSDVVQTGGAGRANRQSVV